MPRLVSLLLLFTTMPLFSSATPLPVGASAPLVSAVTDTGATLDLGTVYSEKMGFLYEALSDELVRR